MKIIIGTILITFVFIVAIGLAIFISVYENTRNLFNKFRLIVDKGLTSIE